MLHSNCQVWPIRICSIYYYARFAVILDLQWWKFILLEFPPKAVTSFLINCFYAVGRSLSRSLSDRLKPNGNGAAHAFPLSRGGTVLISFFIVIPWSICHCYLLLLTVTNCYYHCHCQRDPVSGSFRDLSKLNLPSIQDQNGQLLSSSTTLLIQTGIITFNTNTGLMLSEHWPDPILARENCGQSIGLTVNPRFCKSVKKWQSYDQKFRNCVQIEATFTAHLPRECLRVPPPLPHLILPPYLLLPKINTSDSFSMAQNQIHTKIFTNTQKKLSQLKMSKKQITPPYLFQRQLNSKLRTQ